MAVPSNSLRADTESRSTKILATKGTKGTSLMCLLWLFSLTSQPRRFQTGAIKFHNNVCKLNHFCEVIDEGNVHHGCVCCLQALGSYRSCARRNQRNAEWYGVG